MILDGNKVKKELLIELQNKIKKLPSKIGLAIIQIGTNPNTTSFIKQKIIVLKELNINYHLYNLEENVLEQDVIELIEDLNKDANIDGILLQLPLPAKLNFNTIRNKINPLKDIDGFNNINIAKVLNKEPGFVPCTVRGILTLLNYYNISLTEKNIVIIGRSIHIGKPLLNILTTIDATVTICNSKTKNLAYYTKNADIIITAANHKNLITPAIIKKGSIVIDVTFIKDENKIFGDADFEKIKNICSYITPVPGGVGPMTVYSLMANLYDAYLLNHNQKK